MENNAPVCPDCGKSSNMVLHGNEWVCHSTHIKKEFEYFKYIPAEMTMEFLNKKGHFESDQVQP